MAETPVAERGFAAQFLQPWTEAWNSHDPERLLELMTEDIVYDDSAWPRQMHGHADVREFLDSVWRAVPDLEFQVADGPFVETPTKACFHWTGTGTFTGPLDPPGYAPNGRRFEFDGFDMHEYRDGRVCRLRILFNESEVARQLGLLPPTGSRIERWGAALQRADVRVRRRLRR